jgi:hypothetical protein
MTKIRTLLLITMLPAVLLATLCYMWSVGVSSVSASNAQISRATALLEDTDDEGRSRFHGLVIARPDDGLGEWIIVGGNGVTRTVVVDGQTQLDDGILSPGDWVRVEAKRQGDGALQATRIRLDDREAGELVLRLASDVLSSTIASRYQLTARATLLASGRIYLFNTPQEGDDIEGLIEELQDDPDIVWAEPNYVGRVRGRPLQNLALGWS